MEKISTMQEFINRQLKESRDKSLRNSDQMTLGQMIEKLLPIVERQKERAESDREEATVSFDFEYLYPTDIDSWRGSYCELALNFEMERRGEDGPPPMKVTAFLQMLKEAIGKEFTGYKGGEYIMDEATPVWVANYGHSGNTAVIDIIDDGYRVLIMTGYREF